MKNLDLPMAQNPDLAESCCGGPAGPPAGEHERPGYEICRFVEGFVASAAGPVARVATQLELAGSARHHAGPGLGWRRNGYRVAPGLYAVGRPDAQAPVLVTANYKLSFDTLRSNLDGTRRLAPGFGYQGDQRLVRRRSSDLFTGELLQRLRAKRPGAGGGASATDLAATGRARGFGRTDPSASGFHRGLGAFTRRRLARLSRPRSTDCAEHAPVDFFDRGTVDSDPGRVIDGAKAFR